MPKLEFTHFEHSAYTDTIRMMPQNYCVALKHGERWITDCDAAITDDVAVECFLVVRANSFSKGDDLRDKLNESVAKKTSQSVDMSKGRYRR